MRNDFKSALIVGGSRGVGRDLALILKAEGVPTHVVARGAEDLEAMTDQASGFVTFPKDAAQHGVAEELFDAVQPDLVVLTAGATPKMGSFHQLTWAEFSAAWETDVKIAHNFLTAALRLPMRPGGTVVSFSSGAGLSGSRLSGGYAGAKRM